MANAPLRFLVALAWALCGLASTAWASAGTAARSSGSPVAIAAEVATEGSKTRLTFVLSQAVNPRAFLMERPDRVIVDLPEVNFQLGAEAGRRREGVIASYRYGLFAPGRSRVVLDLAQPALVSRLEVTTRPADGATLLVLELARCDREAFRRAATTDLAGAAASPASGGADVPAGDRRPLLIVDAGHGGIDPGAIARPGLFEKDIVFGFAQRLVQRLSASGRYRVLMTRDRDVFVSLDERVRIARSANAALFISIHADSISSAPQVHGATIYTGSERATDAESARLADRENKADLAAGLEARDSATDVADILQELTVRETRGFSHRFAKRLLTELAPVMQMSVKPQREAGFRVLRAPDVPSVLVELGYLSSRKDLDLLLSTEWRDRTAAAMASAIDRYFGAQDSVAAGATAAVSP
jgi:N-acetylmuramoyl-L-alanine amidase